jgi:hypothetical protein
VIGETGVQGEATINVFLEELTGAMLKQLN